MNYTALGLLLLTMLSSTVDARRCRSNGAAAAGFFGALTGATLAASAYSDQCYYREGPPYDFYYPGAPIYAYDYPTYIYAPTYADVSIRYSIYPSYYYRP
jgi:hypothetical protein